MSNCVEQKGDKRSSVESEKEESVTRNITWQYSWSVNETKDALLKSPFINIPNEILLHLFRFLSVRDLCDVSMVCRSFKMIVDDDAIWKPKCNTSRKLHSKSYKQIYIEWMQEKSLRNKNLYEFESRSMTRTACIPIARSSYPVRSTDKHQLELIAGFNQHPNPPQKKTINLSVDIDKTAPELILLKKVSHFQQQWQHSVVLKQMIKRYYQFMRLKASQPSNILLIPTLDIEIVWQTHLLRPDMYRKDCLRLFRREIDHSLVINNIKQSFKEQAFFDTCQLYEQRFSEKYCSLSSIQGASNYQSYNESIYSYWDKTYFEFSSRSPNDYENPFSFTEGDVIMDGKWFDLCKQFLFDAIEKVPILDCYSRRSTEVDLGSDALKRLKKSYERFLYMAAKYPLKDGNGFIPPTYAIDIIWHLHMQEPLNYAADCLRRVGYVIFHDPWPIIEDENMKNSCDEVDRIWKDEFQCEINIDHLYNTTYEPLDRYPIDDNDSRDRYSIADSDDDYF